MPKTATTQKKSGGKILLGLALVGGIVGIVYAVTRPKKKEEVATEAGAPGTPAAAATAPAATGVAAKKEAPGKKEAAGKKETTGRRASSGKR